MNKHTIITVVVAVILSLAALTIPGRAAFAAADGATVMLSVDETSFGADQPVIVHVTIANPTDHPMKVLKWQTLADDLEGPLFSIKRDGVPVAYIGPLYKRPAPTHEDYLHLKAGESITNDVDIALYYDLSVSGFYRIRYDVAAWNLFSEKGDTETERLTSNEINIWITARDTGSSLSEAPKPGGSGTTTFARCTTSQQAALLSARSAASSYSANAVSYLLSGLQGERYTTWFGSYDTQRYGTVTTHFNSIGNAMNTAPVKFDCGCKKKYYAYVYPNQPYDIYLCRVFWMAPMTGTDSKAGTLIHEMSHFYTVASTDDYAYGQSNAKSLAISDPDKAVANADNHEYFAENNPALP